MLFKRRGAEHWSDRLRLALWPRRSFRRSGAYVLKRTLRLSGTPHAIALGAALGAGVACTPFLGFHLVLTAAIAWMVGGNVIAGALGSFIGNPVTYPVFWAGSYEIGRAILGRFGRHPPPRLNHDLLYESWSQLWPVLEPMIVGSIPLAIAVAGPTYLLVYKAVAAYQASRRVRLAERRRLKVSAIEAALGEGERDR